MSFWGLCGFLSAFNEIRTAFDWITNYFFLCFVCFECLCLLLLEVMLCFLAFGFEGIASVRCHITQTT